MWRAIGDIPWPEFIKFCIFKFISAANGDAISPLHDIPLHANAAKNVYNMVVEVPRWTNAKMEVIWSFCLFFEWLMAITRFGRIVLVYFRSELIRWFRRDKSNDRIIVDQVVIATQNAFDRCGGTMLVDKLRFPSIAIKSTSANDTPFARCIQSEFMSLDWRSVFIR